MDSIFREAVKEVTQSLKIQEVCSSDVGSYLPVDTA
jgi:hypothetical protein